MAAETTIYPTFAVRYRRLLLGGFAVVVFFAAWQAIFLVVPFNPLFMSQTEPDRGGLRGFDRKRRFASRSRRQRGAVLRRPVRGGRCRRAARHRHGLAGAVGYALDPLLTVFYASPLVALAPLLVIFFGVGVSGKAIIVFSLAVFPFIFNACAGVRAADRLLINVVRSLGGRERDLYLKVLLPSVLPYVVAGARIAVGRALIGVLVGEFFAASEGIGFAISRFGDLFAIDHMFACILTVMVIAVALTEGIRWAERAAFPWRTGQ